METRIETTTLQRVKLSCSHTANHVALDPEYRVEVGDKMHCYKCKATKSGNVPMRSVKQILTEHR